MLRKLLCLMLIVALSLGCVSFSAADTAPLKSYEGVVDEYDDGSLLFENGYEFLIKDAMIYSMLTGESVKGHKFAEGEKCVVLYEGTIPSSDVIPESQVLRVLIDAGEKDKAENCIRISAVGKTDAGVYYIKADDSSRRAYLDSDSVLMDSVHKLLEAGSLEEGQIALLWTSENNSRTYVDLLIVLSNVDQKERVANGAITAIKGDIITIRLANSTETVLLDCLKADIYLSDESKELDFADLAVGNKVKAYYNPVLYSEFDLDGFATLIYVNPKQTVDPVADNKDTHMAKFVVGAVKSSNGTVTITSSDGEYVLKGSDSTKITGKNHKSTKLSAIAEGTSIIAFYKNVSGDDPVKGDLVKVVLRNKDVKEKDNEWWDREKHKDKNHEDWNKVKQGEKSNNGNKGNNSQKKSH